MLKWGEFFGRYVKPAWIFEQLRNQSFLKNPSWSFILPHWVKMKSVMAQLQSITLGHFSLKWEMRQEPSLHSRRWCGGCCQLLLQPGGPTGEWCFQARIVKSSTTGINENIIFEGMIDSTEIPIDFFSSLMTCTTCTIRQFIIIRGLQAGFLDTDRSTHSAQHSSSGTFWR